MLKWTRSILLISLFAVGAASSSCQPKIIGGERRIAAIKEGEPAPYSGYVVSQAMMAEIIECVE